MDKQRCLTVSKLQPTDSFTDGEALDEYYKYLIRDRYHLLVFFVLTVGTRYQNNINEIRPHFDKHGQRIFPNLFAVS